MRFVIYIGRFVTTTLMNFAIMFFILSLSVVFVIGNKETIKETLVKSNVYEEVISSALESLDLSSGSTTGNVQVEGSLPLNDPEIQAIIQKSLPPEFIKSEAESLLDDVFAWLDGTDSTLNFEIDFTGARSVFVNDIADYAAGRVDSLPNCSTADISLVPVNIYSVDCRPIGFAPTDVRQQIFNDLDTSEFLRDSVITQDDLEKGIGGTDENELSFAPTAFKVLGKSLAPSIAVFVLVSGLFILVRLPFLRGLRSLGYRLLSSGSIALVFAILFKLLLPTLTRSSGSQNNGAAELTTRVATEFIVRLDTLAIIGFGGIAATGLALIAVSHFISKSDAHKLKMHAESAQTAQAGDQITLQNTPASPYEPEIVRLPNRQD